jgi:DNA-directed RNA polymerase subunit M/transcription elongation factor TFIIS
MAEKEIILNLEELFHQYNNEEDKLELFQYALDPNYYFKNYKVFSNQRLARQQLIQSLKNPEKDEFVFERKRICPLCKKDNWTTISLQIRSADEGETVQYVCTTPNCSRRENAGK